jgi:Bacterial Ig domain
VSVPFVVVTPTPVPVEDKVVRITVPANKSTVSGTVAISLQLSAQVHQVNVFIDGVSLESTPLTTVNWDSRKVPNGIHEITAEAFNSSAIFIDTMLSS